VKIGGKTVKDDALIRSIFPTRLNRNRRPETKDKKLEAWAEALEAAREKTEAIRRRLREGGGRPGMGHRRMLREIFE
jgi:hypothetical protein